MTIASLLSLIFLYAHELSTSLLFLQEFLSMRFSNQLSLRLMEIPILFPLENTLELNTQILYWLSSFCWLSWVKRLFLNTSFQINYPHGTVNEPVNISPRLFPKISKILDHLLSFIDYYQSLDLSHPGISSIVIGSLTPCNKSLHQVLIYIPIQNHNNLSGDLFHDKLVMV